MRSIKLVNMELFTDEIVLYMQYMYPMHSVEMVGCILPN